jgi:hypothetical protein
MPKVGYCSACGGRVRLDESGTACSAGHRVECLSGVEDVEPLADELDASAWSSPRADEPDADGHDHPVVDSMLQGLRKDDGRNLGRRYANAGKLVKLGYLVLVLGVAGCGYLAITNSVNQRVRAAQSRTEAAMRRVQEENPGAASGSAAYPGSAGDAPASPQAEVCYAGQREVESAKAVWEYENETEAPGSWPELMATLRGRAREPRCPGGGTYAIDFEGRVTCSNHGSASGVR